MHFRSHTDICTALDKLHDYLNNYVVVRVEKRLIRVYLHKHKSKIPSISLPNIISFSTAVGKKITFTVTEAQQSEVL